MHKYKSKFEESTDLTAAYLKYFLESDYIREDLKDFVKKHKGEVISIGNSFIDKYEDLNFDDVDKITNSLKRQVKESPEKFPLIIRLFFGEEL